MNININDIKNGMTVIIDGNLCMITEFQHVKPGKLLVAGADGV